MKVVCTVKSLWLLDMAYTVQFFSLVLFKVYCIDQTYTTIRVPVSSSVKEVISAVADKLGSGEGLIIVKMSSGGGTVFASSLTLLTYSAAECWEGLKD